MTSNNIPNNSVFIVHNGYKEYLRYCLKFAKRSGNTIVLVSDRISLERLKHYYDFGILDDLDLPEYELFKTQYEHMSTNPVNFELLCFKRFFLVAKLCEIHQVGQFFLIDSDLALLGNVSTLTKITSSEVSLSMQRNSELDVWGSASPHFSFWTSQSIGDFVRFLGLVYTEKKSVLFEKYQYHIDFSLPGGVCDMTALSLWLRSGVQYHNNSIIGDVDVDGDLLIDHNINVDANYEKEKFSLIPIFKIKKIRLKDGMFLSYSNSLKKDVPVFALHFQGSAKPYMRGFYFENSINFINLFLSAPAMLLKNIIPKFVKSLARNMLNR
jgi:hypothetical protein